MLFHTELTPEKLPVPLRLADRIVTLGSCFAETMGQRMADYKLSVRVNPLGTVFNPVSIHKLVTLALNGEQPDESLYVERDGFWFHFDFHSSLHAPNRVDFTKLLMTRLQEVGQALRQADWLVLTLGSAVVYRHVITGQVVGNCHKTPAAQFEQYLYQIDHLRDDLNALLKRLRRANPSLRVLLTVSPVRHGRDMLPLNAASKATLRVLCHELTIWNDWVHYFPAYEIMQDDLRDYRFYEADLTHPNMQAHEYIFDKFAQSAFDADLKSFVTDWAGIRQALAHRPLNPASDAHRQFLTRLLTQLERWPGRADVSAELAEVRSRLETILT